MLKKSMIVMAAAVLAGLMISGCQGSPAAVSEADQPVETGSDLAAGAAGQEVKLTIIHTNDVHSHVAVEPYVKALNQDLRENGEHVILISAGDAYTGTPFASLSDGHNITKVMNDVGYELFVFGNHEQNENEKLKEAIAELACPQLGGNAPQHILDANPQIQDYVIREYDGVKVAFLGITTDDNATEGIGDEWVAFTEQMKADAESEGATVFVAVAHLGIYADDKTKRSTYIADHCPWLDVIIDGHCHTVHENGLMHNDVLIAETGEYGNNIGIIELTMKDGVVTERSAGIIPIVGNEDACGIVPDESLSQMIAEIDVENEVYLSTVIAELPIDLDGERQDVRTADTNFGNLTADAMMRYIEADVAVIPGWFLRCSVPKGGLTNEMFMTMFPFNQSVYTEEISGQELWERMESALSSYPDASPEFLHISGMRIVYDPQKEPMERVVSITMADGSAFNPDAVYTYAYISEEDLDGSLGIVNQMFLDYLNEGGEMPGEERRIEPLQ
ncbi:MAG: bifunctional metallophosphatase/5'-nucleotidase [Lachnospiraceae bacterium]